MAVKVKQLGDQSPGRNMHSVTNLSQLSLAKISVEYNEGRAVTKSKFMLDKSSFMRKSHSINGG